VVELARDGRAAVELARRGGYDVILMDVQMPEVDGLEAARQLRAEGCATPVVALTASVESEVRAACEAAGMVDFVAKPFRPAEVAAALRRVLG